MMGLLPWVAVVAAFFVSDFTFSGMSFVEVLLTLFLFVLAGAVIGFVAFYLAMPLVRLAENAHMDEKEKAPILCGVAATLVQSAVYFVGWYVLFQYA